MATTAGGFADRSENSGRSIASDLVLYLVLAFGFSWFMWITAIKLGLSEPFLNIGTAGPAVAAFALSWNHRRSATRPAGKRWPHFFVLLVICWSVLRLRYWWPGETPDLRTSVFLLVPALFPAWIVSSVLAGNEGGVARSLLHKPGRWTVFALLYFPVLLGIPSILAYALHARLMWPQPQGSHLTTIGVGLVFFLFNLLFVGALEEPGWRGFLLDRLQTKLSPLSASLLVWLPWALWHGPLDYYRPVRFSLVEYALLRVVFLIPLTIILTWLYNRAGRSIQATAFFHASMNTFPFVFPYYQPAWLLVFAFAAYAVIADRMWSRSGVAAGKLV